MLLSRHVLPPIPALSSADKWLPTAVALPCADTVLAAFGANTLPMTVVRAGADVVVREYPAVDTLEFLDANRTAITTREKAGDFDASADVWSRLHASRVLQRVVVAGAPWLVRANGHARLDPVTLDVTPVPRSAVRWLVALPGGELLAGAGAEYTSSDAFQRFVRGPNTLLDDPIFRSRTQLTGNSDWVFAGTTLPVGNPATAFTAGVKALGVGGGASTLRPRG